MSVPFNFRDFLVFGGIGLIGYGFYLVHPPVAFIVCGMMLFWIGRPR